MDRLANKIKEIMPEITLMQAYKIAEFAILEIKSAKVEVSKEIADFVSFHCTIGNISDVYMDCDKLLVKLREITEANNG